MEDHEVPKYLTRRVSELMEHFDSVQIFASNYKNGNTNSYAYGGGNWNTRDGQIRQWIKQNDAMIIEDVRRRYESEE